MKQAIDTGTDFGAFVDLDRIEYAIIVGILSSLNQNAAGRTFIVNNLKLQTAV